MAGDSRLSARFGADVSDFKNGLNEINRELRVVESGFKASASALGDWSSSATGLETRISALNKEIDLQKEKCGALRYQLEQLRAAHGENSVEAQNAEIKLNKETETLNKMENELKDTTGALKKMGDQTSQTGNQAQESGKKFKGLGEIIGSVKDIIKNSMVIIAGVGVALKKALDFGEAGAETVQIGESFNFLTEQIGASADVLDRLMVASRGTIDDEEIMAATMKMLTGTSEELSLALIENAPALMEIAKAANKLNPTMGSTLELYESISSSIKDLTPRGLKQVGIVIDSTAAYEDYARSIGKAASALTEEEKSMALMNATLAKGKDILQQVGGNTEAATDRFLRANLAIENLKETIQVGLMPVLADYATGLTVLLGGKTAEMQDVTTAWGRFISQLTKGSTSALSFADAYSQKVQETTDMLVNQGYVWDRIIGLFTLGMAGPEGTIRADEQARDVILELSNSYDEYAQAMEAAGLSFWTVNKAEQWLTQTEFKHYKQLQDLIKSGHFAAMSFEEYQEELQRMTGINFSALDSTNFFGSALRKMSENIYNATQATNDLSKAEGELGQSTVNYINDIDRSGLANFGFRESVVGVTADLQAMQDEGFTTAEAWSEYQKALADADQQAQELRQTLGEDLVAALQGVQQAQQNWMSGTGEDIASKLKDWLGTGKLYRDGIAAIDEVYGTSLVNNLAYLEAVKKLQAAYATTGDLDAFKQGLVDLRDEFMPTDEAVVAAQEKVENLQTQLDTLSKTEVNVPVTIDVGKVNIAPGVLEALKNIGGGGTGTGTGTGGGSSGGGNLPHQPLPFARGGGGIVPPGYPDDSYLVGLTSGEEFFVGALARAQRNINVAVAGMNMTTTPNMSGAGGAGGAGVVSETNVTIASGAIVVNASPGMDEETLAQKVVDKLGDSLATARSKGLR